MPALVRVIDHQGRYALGLQLGLVLDHAVGTGGGEHQQVRIDAEHRLDIEHQVGVQHLDLARIGDARPLAEKALAVGHPARGGGSSCHQRCLHGQQDAGDTRRGRGNPQRLGLPGRDSGCRTQPNGGTGKQDQHRNSKRWRKCELFHRRSFFGYK
ncbi:hypothetical protein D3C72_1955370 [compost metagenome]